MSTVTGDWSKVMAGGREVGRPWRVRVRYWLQDRLARLSARIGSHPGTDDSMCAYRYPPQPGQWRNLVAGECRECGWHVACPEGHTWPFCPNCGIRVMPANHYEPGATRYGYAARFDEELKVLDQVPQLSEVDPL